ncbi:MAG: EMC3/TMCO1 family protein [Thaumarchaeota archaeon]|nr:EMC3/TMCO1 family protein [Nitrososphaerota archaeon]
MSLGSALPALIVSLTSIGVSLISNLLTRRFVNLTAERRMKAEIASYQAELKAAVAAKDKKKEDQLRKKDKQIAQMRLKISSARTKIGFGTIIPFFAVYYLMANFLGGFSVIVAHSPIPIPYIISTFCTAVSSTCPTLGGPVSLFWWYFLSSLSFSSMLTKLMGTST